MPHERGSYLVRTNSLGMRSDREYPLHKPKGRQRIVLLGDSYAAGDGVNNSERFSDRLEAFYPHLDVLNFGLPNSGTDQQLLVYETLAKPFEADAYLFAIVVENVLRNQQRYRPAWEPQTDSVSYRPKPYFTVDNERLVLHHQPVPLEKYTAMESAIQQPKSSNLLTLTIRQVARHVLPSRLRRAIFRQLYGQPQPFAGYESIDSSSWHLLRHIVLRFCEQVGEKPVFILPLPTYHFFLSDVAPIYMQRFITLENRSRSRFVVNVLPYFLRLPLSDRQRCRFSTDPHYSPFAHAVVMQALSDAISEFRPELLTPKEN